MSRTVVLLVLCSIPGSLPVGTVVAEDAIIGVPKGVNVADWPWWRGPGRVGVAPCETAPTSWSAEENVVWRAKVPGRGHASPIVVGDRVYLPSADEGAEVQMVLCYDRATGEQLWRTDVHEGGFDGGGNKRSSQASGSVAFDGERLFVNFLNRGAVWLTALDLDGKQLWQKRVSGFVNHQGFGASPAIYDDLVLASADNKGGGAVAAYERSTGKLTWSVDRPDKANYTSPVLLDISGKHQAIYAGCDLVTSLDPTTGKTLWEVEGATTECVTSVVAANGLIFTSGGYPRNHIQAVKTDGSGTTAWENNTRVYVPSMITRGDHLYAVTDAGIAVCHEVASGELVWRERIPGGTFNASLVLVGENVYATGEDGTTTIFRATPERFESIGRGKLGDEVFGTPAICGGRIYHRVAVKGGGERQEWLYCLGE